MFPSRRGVPTVRGGKVAFVFGETVLVSWRMVVFQEDLFDFIASKSMYQRHSLSSTRTIVKGWCCSDAVC